MIKKPHMMDKNLPMRKLIAFLIILLGVQVLAQDNNPPLYDLPDPFADRLAYSGTMAFTPRGRLVTVNYLAGSVSIVSPVSGTVDAEIPTGAQPYAVSITPDGSTAVIINRGDATFTVLDLNELTVRRTARTDGAANAVVAADNESALIAEARGIVRYDLATGTELEVIETPSEPYGLAMWGSFLYVTHPDGTISLIYLPQSAVVRTIRPADNAGITPSLAINPRRGTAFLPTTLNNTHSPFTTLDNRLIPYMTVLDLARMTADEAASLNLIVADRPVSAPWGALLNSNQTRLYVTHAGSGALSVINLQTGLAEAHVETGTSPRTVLFSRDNLLLYVHDMIDGTLSIVETQFYSVRDTLPLTTTPLDPVIMIGARLYYDSADTRISGRENIGCAGCHMDAAPSPPDGDTLNAHIIEQTGGSGIDGIDMEALVQYLRDMSR